MDYYCGTEAEQFSFIRVPKILVKDESFRSISNTAKLMYGLLLDRMSLSVRNGWLDSENRVYIYYKIEELTEELNCSKPKVIKLMSELEGIGLIERKKRGFGKPDMIYVKKFIRNEENGEKEAEKKVNTDDDSDYLPQRSNFFTIADKSAAECHTADADAAKRENGMRSNIFTSHGKKILLHEVKKFYPNNTEYNNTEYNNLSFTDMTGKRSDNSHCSTVCDVCDNHNGSEQMLRKVIDRLITDVMTTDEKYLRVCGNYMNSDMVKEQFSQLGELHIEYVISTMRIFNRTVHNMKSYLLTALYQTSLLDTDCINAQLEHNRKKEKIRNKNRFNNFHGREPSDKNAMEKLEKQLLDNCR